MVAGHERHLAAAERFAQLLEERPGCLQRAPDGEVAELDHVAEQDDAVRVGDLLEKSRRAAGVAEHVFAAGGAEVQVGDDRGSHSRPFTPRTP